MLSRLNVLVPKLVSPRSTEACRPPASGPGAPMYEYVGPQTRIHRAPVRAIAQARVVSNDREIYGQVINLALGGCLFATETTLADGERLELSVVVLAPKRRIVADVSARVVRRTEHGGRRAYGLAFIAESTDERQLLQWLYGQAMRP